MLLSLLHYTRLTVLPKASHKPKVYIYIYIKTLVLTRLQGKKTPPLSYSTSISFALNRKAFLRLQASGISRQQKVEDNPHLLQHRQEVHLANQGGGAHTAVLRGLLT